MTDQTVTTNLRMDRHDWLQIKTLAAEQGMSFNEYVNGLIKNVSAWIELVGKLPERSDRSSIWSLPNLMKGKNRVKAQTLSPDDELIYE